MTDLAGSNRWEHRSELIRLDSGGNTSSSKRRIETVLNELRSQGWELASSALHSDRGPGQMEVVLTRARLE